MLSAAYARFAQRTLKQLEFGAVPAASVRADLELVRAAVDRMKYAPLSARRYRRRAARLGAT
jgi:hypothetical protein